MQYAKLSAASRLKLFEGNVKQFFCMSIALICFSALDIQVEIMREFTLVPVEKRRNKTGNFLIFVNKLFLFFFYSKRKRKRDSLCIYNDAVK